MQYPPKGDSSVDSLSPEQLIGRVVSLRWTDGLFYKALIISFDCNKNTHRILYMEDEALENDVRLSDCDWVLMPRIKRMNGRPYLSGAIVEFVHPDDRNVYSAMVYECNDQWTKVKVAYLEHCNTQRIIGDFLITKMSNGCAFSWNRNPVDALAHYRGVYS